MILSDIFVAPHIRVDDDTISVKEDMFHSELLIFYIDDLVATAAALAFCDIEHTRRGEEGSQLVIAVVARIEVRLLFLQECTDISEESPTVVS
jgi:hypothetical protein